MSNYYEIFELYGFGYDQSRNFVTALQLVGCVNQTIVEFSTTDECLEDLNARLQDNFLRPFSAERQQVVDKFTDHNLRRELASLLTAFIEEMRDGADEPNKILLGASEVTVKQRLDFLIKLTHEGYNRGNISSWWRARFMASG